jgi:glycosyltransferase involved in cell wall biosynthesis
MSQLSVSCIVPVYNGERYLKQAVDSILAQSYRPLEVIVADDGSTDRTVALLAGYGDRVRYLKQNNCGPAATRNLGLNAARGEFLAFLDQDDLWHQEKLKKQLARFAARPELDACIAHVKLFWVGEMQEEAARLQNHSRGRVVPGYTTGTLLTRRTLFDQVGGFDTSLWFGDATDWFLRVEELGKVIELMPDVLLYHRMHESNLTRRRSTASKNEFLHIVKRRLDRQRGSSETSFPEFLASRRDWQSHHKD